jgi:hypothetical protein
MRRSPATAMVVIVDASNKSSQLLFTTTTRHKRLNEIDHIPPTSNDGIIIDLILGMLRRTRWGHCGYCIINCEIVNIFDTSYYGEQ